MLIVITFLKEYFRIYLKFIVLWNLSVEYDSIIFSVGPIWCCSRHKIPGGHWID